MLNIYDDLKKDYEVKIDDIHKHIDFYFKGEYYTIYDNGLAIILIYKLKAIHIVPVMLSCTDVFFINYIRNNYKALPVGQLSIFDFL